VDIESGHKLANWNSIKQKMINGFATSHPGLMLGSVIPGLRQEIARTRLASYLDLSEEKLLRGRPPSVNPLIPPPAPGNAKHSLQNALTMNQQHAQGHSFMEKLKQVMSGGGPQHPGFHGPQMRQGYEAVRENRDWRRS
jgi:hypothetical protein